MKKKEPVAIIPKRAKKTRKFFFAPALSAIVPRIGAIKTMQNPAIEFVLPRTAELEGPSSFDAQYDLKKIGKKPATTVVQKALLAQSYNAHENLSLFNKYLNIKWVFKKICRELVCHKI